MGAWTVYILRCADGTLYTGVTDDLRRRVADHNAGRGAKYTRGRGPVEPVYRELAADRSAALRREKRIKALSRPQKEALIASAGGAPVLPLPAPVERALTMLHLAGFEAWAVGGAVRDRLMGREPGDWDVCTAARPEETEAVFAGERLMETGLQHGTVTVLLDGMPLEVTTYRADGAYSDHRHPDAVRFSDSLTEDLARRDLTVNALAYAPGRGVADPFGGEEDIRRGLLRAVGEPERRFEEDALRILRTLRFASQLGFQIEPATAAAMGTKKGLLTLISAERVREELTKLLCGSAAAPVLRQYRELAAEVLPELRPTFGFEQHNPHHCFDVWEHTLTALAAIPPQPALRWAALLHDLGKPACFFMDEAGVGHFYGHGKESAALADSILRRLKFPNAERECIVRLIEQHDTPIPPERRAVKRRLAKLGEEDFFRLLALHRADVLAQAEINRPRLRTLDAIESLARELIAEAACLSLKDLAVNGNDLKALGFKGPALGRALADLLDAVVDERVENERAALLKLSSEIKDQSKE